MIQDVSEVEPWLQGTTSMNKVSDRYLSSTNKIFVVQTEPKSGIASNNDKQKGGT